MRGKHKESDIIGKAREGVNGRQEVTVWAGISQHRKGEKGFVVDHS